MKRGRPATGGTTRNSNYYTKKFRPSATNCKSITNFFNVSNSAKSDAIEKTTEADVNESAHSDKVDVNEPAHLDIIDVNESAHLDIIDVNESAYLDKIETSKSNEIEFQSNGIENESQLNVTEPIANENASTSLVEGSASESGDNAEFELEEDIGNNEDKTKQKYIASYERLYNWLYYSYSANGFLCKMCSSLENKNDLDNRPWESVGVDIKKGRHPTRVLKKHENSKRHKQAVEARKYKTKKGILTCVSESGEAAKAAKTNFNRKLISKFINILYFMVKKQWAVSTNFEGLVRFLGEHLDDNELKKHVETCAKNATYLSHVSVQAIINSISVYLEQKLLTELSCADFFALMADECTDEAQREQLGIIVRYRLPGDYNVKEKYLGLVHLRSTTAEAITSALEVITTAKNIKLSNCLFIALDGPNVMSGERSGVQRRIRHISPHSIYINCRNHKLALVFVHLLKKHSNLKSIDSLLVSLWKLFHYSPKKFDVFKEIQKNVYGLDILKVMKVSTTRWLSHGRACERIAARYEQLVDTLDSLYVETREPELKGLRDQLLDPNILLTVLFLADFLGKVDVLNLWLQSPDITFSLLNAKVNDLITEVENYCMDVEKGDSFKMNKKLMKIAVDGTALSIKMRSKSKSKESVLKDFKENFVVEFLNDFKREMDLAFELSSNTSSLKGFNVFSSRNLNALSEDDIDIDDNLSILMSHYGKEKKDIFKDSVAVSKPYVNIDDTVKEKTGFTKEILFAKMSFDIEKNKAATLLLQKNKKDEAKKALEKKMTPNDLQESLEKNSSTNWDMYPNFMKLLSMCTIIPSSTASVERLFSRMNLVCTEMRTSLKQESLDEQLRIIINGPEALTKQDCEEIVDIFKSRGNRRLLL